MHEVDSDSISNGKLLFYTENLDKVEYNVSFYSIIKYVGLLSIYSASEHLYPYRYESVRDMEKCYLPNFYYEEKINQCIPQFSRDEMGFKG